MGSNGKQEALERWHPEKIAAKVRSMFEEVLEISKKTAGGKM
jgi:hypothetical protein